jgi:predicted MFS family arabinose efflux permease
LKEIVVLIGKDRIVALILVSFAMIALFSSAAFTILVYMVQQVLKMGTAGVGFMRGLLAVGMIIGALGLGLFHIKIRKINIVVLGFLAYGLLFTIGPFLIYKATIVAIAILGGLLYSVILVAQNTILQEQVSSQIRGRVFAVKELLFNITFIITAILIGIISDLTSFKIVLFSVGLILLAFAIVTFILTRNSQVKSR